MAKKTQKTQQLWGKKKKKFFVKTNRNKQEKERK